jgi:hypothetical protein
MSGLIQSWFVIPTIKGWINNLSKEYNMDFWKIGTIVAAALASIESILIAHGVALPGWSVAVISGLASVFAANTGNKPKQN